mmetsp:Transcript_84230/g.212392  ORF Transcript_84230/g.212392 Transcript_84230/m.212392 type:complete len:203 (-) Transcript_84230:46-654(-)
MGVPSRTHTRARMRWPTSPALRGHGFAPRATPATSRTRAPRPIATVTTSHGTGGKPKTFWARSLSTPPMPSSRIVASIRTTAPRSSWSATSSLWQTEGRRRRGAWSSSQPPSDNEGEDVLKCELSHAAVSRAGKYSFSLAAVPLVSLLLALGSTTVVQTRARLSRRGRFDRTWYSSPPTAGPDSPCNVGARLIQPRSPSQTS